MSTYCDEHTGHRENIREFREFKKAMMGADGNVGIIDRLWQSIEKKVSKGIIITFAFIIVTFVSGLFGLVYHSNSQVLHEMVGIKVNISLINDKLK